MIPARGPKQKETILSKSSFKFYICDHPFLVRNRLNLSPVHFWQVTQGDVGKPNQATLLSFTLSALLYSTCAVHIVHTLTLLAGGIKIGEITSALSLLLKREQDEAPPAFGSRLLRNSNHLISFCTGHLLGCPNGFIWQPCTPARQVSLMHLKSS